MMRRIPPLLLAFAMMTFAAGCVNQKIRTVEAYRAAYRAGDHETARRHMSDDPRRWWNEREGEGTPWTIGGKGRWSDWDEHFRSRSEPVRWIAGDDSVTLIVEEVNDYYLLTERGPQLNRLVYYLDEEGRICGLLISGEIEGVERSMGRAEEFDAWLEASHPDEYAYLRPGGEIDPTGDRPERTRRMLEAWRREVELPPLSLP